MTRITELTGSTFTATECASTSLSEALAEAVVVVARQERKHVISGVLYNDSGAVRIVHNQDEDGHQILVIFEGGDY